MIRRTDFEEIVDFLSFFVKTRNYSIVDRIGLASSPRMVIAALYEAMRLANVVRSRRIEPFKLEVDGRELLVTDACIVEPAPTRYEPDIEGKLLQRVGDIPFGVRVHVIRCPRIPSKEVVEAFIEEISRGDRGMDTARKVASLALASPGRESGSSGGGE